MGKVESGNARTPTENRRLTMQAVQHPQLVKTSSSATQNKGVQANPAARGTNEKKAGNRFLNFLMSALSALAV
jgi:hypothetical protein